MKVPFPAGARFFFRFLIPGLIAATLPYYVMDLSALGHLPGGGEPLIRLSVLTVLFGWLAISLDQHIYMLFEGRRYWPKWLARLMRAREQRAVQLLAGRADADTDYEEALVDLYRFKYDESVSRHVATRPTRLGNVIDAYEHYPFVTYQMHGVFYWYRIWLSVPQELRVELDENQAMSDSVVYISFFAFAAAPLLLVAKSIGDLAGTPIVLLDWAQTFWTAGGALLVGYLAYRMSIRSHISYGEYFKALFDQYHDAVDVTPVLDVVSQLTGDPRVVLRRRDFGRYLVAWDYLKWRSVRMPPDGKHRNVDELLRSQTQGREQRHSVPR